ncbi:MAG: zinc-dependent alcohol dehydrogenase family protein [Thermoanaerobaculia bacterium]
MKAWVLEKPENLILKDIDRPAVKDNEIKLKVEACGICHTDLHEFRGEIPLPVLPVVMGHQIIGRVVEKGEGVSGFELGDLAGVPWLNEVCGVCEFCKKGLENLCENPKFTGLHINGGFAQFHKTNYRFAYKLPAFFEDIKYAPLLCGGVIGWRALKQTKLKGKGEFLGLYGFGSSAHIVLQIANYLGYKVFVFSRSKDHRNLALKLGAEWAGEPSGIPPSKMDGSIVFAPKGFLMIEALKNTKKAGRVVSAGIYMDDLPSFPYNLLWEERVLTSVANSTREDVRELLEISEKFNLKIEAEIYPFEELPQALFKLEEGKIQGSAVLKVD